MLAPTKRPRPIADIGKSLILFGAAFTKQTLHAIKRKLCELEFI